MTNHSIPRMTPSQETGLQIALHLRMPEGHSDCGWHRDDQGRPMLMWLGWWREQLGEGSSRLQRALTALEGLAPGSLTRRRGDSALVHLEALNAAVAAAPEGSALALVREAEEEQRNAMAREAAERLTAFQQRSQRPPVLLPEGTAEMIRQAIREGQMRGLITDTGDITHLADTVVRMGIRTTSGSTYEFEPALSRARFVSGPHGPTSSFAPAGSWHEFLDASMPTVGTRVLIRWEGDRITTLTPVSATWAIGVIDPLADLPPLPADPSAEDADVA